MIASLAIAAFAGDDVSVTTLGADVVSAQAIGEHDEDLLVGQRLRWELRDGLRALVDGRFAVDPSGPPGSADPGSLAFENSRVRELGVAIESGPVSLLVGRHLVTGGGPRLCDGVQALAHVGPHRELSFGAWGGLVPDEFTTEPTSRFGAGPIVSWDRVSTSVSATGDLVSSSAGLERLGALVMARGELGSKLQADGRLDWLFADALGNSGLADGAVYLRYRPQRAVRLDGFYDGYSSLRYQTRSDLDPAVQRFASRLEDLGLDPGITADVVDPTVHHLFGVTFGARGVGQVQPIATLRARALLHPDRAERYQKLGATLGLGGLAGDQLEIDLDGNALSLDTGIAGDAGVMALYEPGGDSAVAVDGSVRALFDPAFAGQPGWYADVFVDLATARGTALAVGASWTSEPSDVLGQDVGLAGFLRFQQWVRPGRSARAMRGPDGAAVQR